MIPAFFNGMFRFLTSFLYDTTTGATVSSEPMYIILNTAVSGQWGFPHQCPPGCPCKNFDCNSKDWQDICGFPHGFCDMMTNKTNVPSYKVNYIRVYQNPSDPHQKVGCSTPERPTKKYIKANQDLYKTVNDVSTCSAEVSDKILIWLHFTYTLNLKPSFSNRHNH